MLMRRILFMACQLDNDVGEVVQGGHNGIAPTYLYLLDQTQSHLQNPIQRRLTNVLRKHQRCNSRNPYPKAHHVTPNPTQGTAQRSPPPLPPPHHQ